MARAPDPRIEKAKVMYLEDNQEMIFVLTNYGGEDLGQFLRDLKDYKAIQIESDGDGDHSGVSTLTIELPVEAREKLLEITRKCIFELRNGWIRRKSGN